MMASSRLLVSAIFMVSLAAPLLAATVLWPSISSVDFCNITSAKPTFNPSAGSESFFGMCSNKGVSNTVTETYTAIRFKIPPQMKFNVTGVRVVVYQNLVEDLFNSTQASVRYFGDSGLGTPNNSSMLASFVYPNYVVSKYGASHFGCTPKTNFQFIEVSHLSVVFDNPTPSEAYGWVSLSPVNINSNGPAAAVCTPNVPSSD